MTASRGINLNSMFTRNMLQHFIDGKTDPAYSSAVGCYADKPFQKSNQELLHEIYEELRKNYRNEYYYKNTILNKLLLGKHSVNTTTALTEISVAKSKADFVLINGKAVVYEIKTELDNFDRLESQIYDYYKAFDHVAVVACEKNLPQLQGILKILDFPIGIYVLRKNGRLGELRKPEKYTKNLNKEVIFKLLRKKEYESILGSAYGNLPDVTQFRYYNACKEMFLKIPLENSYQMVLNQLKNRIKIQSKEQFSMVPYELRFPAYFMKLSDNDYQKLDEFLKCRYGGV